jgi:hypothetical protein
MGDEFWLPTQALLQGPSPLVKKPKVRRERPARARISRGSRAVRATRDENATTAAIPIPLTRVRR